jgi:hypothetical protein
MKGDGCAYGVAVRPPTVQALDVLVTLDTMSDIRQAKNCWTNLKSDTMSVQAASAQGVDS